MCVTKIISINKYVPILIYINTCLRGREREGGKEGEKSCTVCWEEKKQFKKAKNSFFWRGHTKTFLEEPCWHAHISQKYCLQIFFFLKKKSWEPQPPALT